MITMGRLRRTYKAQYIAGSPGSPAVPAHCVTHWQPTGQYRVETVQQGINPGIPGTPTIYPVGYKGQFYIEPMPPGTYEKDYLVPIYKEVKTCYPETPAVPAVPHQIEKIASSNWHASARSQQSFMPGQYFEATLRPGPVAILVAARHMTRSFSMSTFLHAVTFRTGSVTVTEGGQDKARVAGDFEKVRVERRDGVIVYKADDVVVAEYRDTAQSTPLHAYSMLYSVGDYLDNAMFGAVAGGISSFHITTHLDDTPGGMCVFRIQTEATVLSNGMAHAGGLSVMSMRTHAEARAVWPASGESDLVMQSDVVGVVTAGSAGTSEGVTVGLGFFGLRGDAWEVPVIRGTGYLPAPHIEGSISTAEILDSGASGGYSGFHGEGFMLSGGVMSGDGDLGMRGRGSQDEFLTGTVQVMLSPTIAGWVDHNAPGYSHINSTAVLADTLILDAAVVFAFIENVQVETYLDVYALISASLFEAVEIGGFASLKSTIELMIKESLYISQTNNYASGREAIQYAVNAVTGALSRYEGFGFKQFATVGCRTFAITDTGLFELGANEDDGDLIGAMIDFGATDYGSAQRKIVSSLYAGIDTDGDVYFRLSGDQGEERIYRPAGAGGEVRAMTAKGLAARHWRLRLVVDEASEIDLDNVEIEIGVSQRRLGR